MEIKFRAWDKQRCKMSKPFGLNDLPKYENYDGKEEYNIINPSILVMQYTGLEDKNNRKIFEWDILYDEMHKIKRIVKLIKRGLDGNYVFSDGEDEYYGGVYHGDNIKIIGNIYEGVNDETK